MEIKWEYFNKGIFEFSVKDDTDYLGRSFMEPPKYTGTNLREDFVPDRCYPPTKQASGKVEWKKRVNFYMFISNWFCFFEGAHIHKSHKVRHRHPLVSALSTYVPLQLNGWKGVKFLCEKLIFTISKIELFAFLFSSYLQVKLWEVYGNRKLIRTYTGHKVPVKDIYFNASGTEFLSAAYDNYIKLWDTETGKNSNGIQKKFTFLECFEHFVSKFSVEL